MQSRIIIVISSDIEWKIVCDIIPDCVLESSPFGQWFTANDLFNKIDYEIIFYHGGWGKISAAASAQYIIDRWHPVLLVNLGTCGGFQGFIEVGTIILVEKTIVYDIIEQMGDFNEHIAHYTTDIDLSWLEDPFPHQVQRSTLLSGDRDLQATDVKKLIQKYSAIAADWESGSLAWVASRNHTKLLILRGVSDLVSSCGGEAYGGNIKVFTDNASDILNKLIFYLPEWISRAKLR